MKTAQAKCPGVFIFPRFADRSILDRHRCQVHDRHHRYRCDGDDDDDCCSVRVVRYQTAARQLPVLPLRG